MARSTQCSSCKWQTGVARCMAFERIPQDILNGSVSHRDPVEGDGGYQWAPIEYDADGNMLPPFDTEGPGA